MTNLTHNSFLCVYFNSVHVSSNLVLIIRRINCINTTSGIRHSVSVTVSCAGRKVPFRPAHETVQFWFWLYSIFLQKKVHLSCLESESWLSESKNSKVDCRVTTAGLNVIEFALRNNQLFMVFVVVLVWYATEVNAERRRPNEQTERENVVFSNVRTKVPGLETW